MTIAEVSQKYDLTPDTLRLKRYNKYVKNKMG